MTKARRFDPSLWASRKPFGIGEQRPNNYLEIWKALWENRDNLGYAWRIQRLAKEGDEFQYGGPLLAAGWKFPTPDGKAHFVVAPLPKVELPEGVFLATTRRGKQFNSMVHERRDALTGAVREAVLISRVDAERPGLADGDRVVLSNDLGKLRGRVLIAPVKPGNVEINWPEGEVLINSGRRSPQAGIPDYNAVVSLEPAATTEAAPVEA